MGGYPSVLIGSVSVCHFKINEQTYSRPRLRESTYHLGRSIPQSSNNESIDSRLYAKAAQAFINQFWESWLRNMPPHLLFRSKWFQPRQNLEVGDYVIVLKPGLKGQTAPRGLWEHAIVTEVFPGNDGLV